MRQQAFVTVVGLLLSCNPRPVTQPSDDSLPCDECWSPRVGVDNNNKADRGESSQSTALGSTSLW
jgi:hypothetical protein